jgi:heat shock protein HtpX
MSHAKPIQKSDSPELYRIVENLAITAGLPMPKLYSIEDAQPNAFATGRDGKHAVVATTTGLLQRLERVELEGVLAHELSHIGNKDMLVSTIVVVLVGVVAILTDFFLRASFHGGFRGNDDRRSGQLGILLLVVGILFAILAPIIAQLIKMAVSRKREFLADASGALLTRYPEGLARALEKIAADPHQLRSASDATAHLYIASPFRGKEKTSWIHKLFMTHPPVEERVAALRGLKIEN